jgi:succinate dehydrogenase / fumarate reductase membrane anchor subunit
MSMRSPLGRVLGLGSAKHGVAHWYAQRLTAVAVALLGVWFLVSLYWLNEPDFRDVQRWLSSPVSATLLLLFVVTAGWHAQLGLQVIIEDYVGDKAMRLILLVAMKFAYVVATVIGALAVLRLAFGAAA